jgi:acyl carrier protein
VTRAEIQQTIVALLARLMPDVDPAALTPDASLRKSLTADSMDTLNFVTALHDELGIEVPEQDYAQLDTLEGCVAYVDAALAAKTEPPLAR